MRLFPIFIKLFTANKGVVLVDVENMETKELITWTLRDGKYE